ncbi:hypothetical protein EKO27_g1741 [Xylaria grammica]|uniref:C2H2-type domain-containing protein n=1 Tax=Xylaria grammica TaxID=363999 RepID=A0A439DG63_9PEZI|nr:hypothetical protein EKO27_g1741 [Xylaria grammica]
MHPIITPAELQNHSTTPGVAGTDTAIRASTQSETSAQQSHELASGQWAADGGRSDLIPVPIHEPLHHSSSYNDTSSALPNGSPRYLASLYQLIAQSDSDHSGSGVDYSIHHSSEITGSSVGVLQNTRNQAEPATRAKRKYIAVDDIASDASAPNSADGSAQACAIPTLPGGIPSNIIPSGWPNSLHDVSIQFPADSQIPSPSFRLSPPAWISDDDCDYTTLSQPQLHLIDCDPFELPPSSNAKSLNVPQSSRANRITTGAPKKYECCKSSCKQRLACPFYKYEPQLHPNCMFKSFKTIGHMGQHLKQNHKLKPNHCKLCWRSFETTDLLTNHTQYCVQTGGVSVNGMGKFPRMRWPVEKKWYWCWEKLFGKEVMQPECPFSHPIDDLQSHLLAQYNNPLKLEYIAGEWAGEDDGSTNCTNYTERPSLSTSPD